MAGANNEPLAGRGVGGGFLLKRVSKVHPVVGQPAGDKVP